MNIDRHHGNPPRVLHRDTGEARNRHMTIWFMSPRATTTEEENRT